MTYCDIGIDFGSTSTKIFIKDCGLVANTSSVVALKKPTGELIDIGQRAYSMIGKAPSCVVVKSPLSNGAIADFELTRLFISEMLARVLKNPIKNPRLFLCVHSCETEFEKFMLINSIFSCQSGKIFLIEEPVAAGFGAGFDLNFSNNLVVVNIGGGTTDIAFIASEGLVSSFSTKIGGQDVDEAICKNVFKRYGLMIGRISAEKLKIQAANLKHSITEQIFKLNGKDRLTGLPRSLFLSGEEVSSLISKPLKKIVDEIAYFVYSVSSRRGFIYSKSRILLTGGGSLIGGLRESIENRLHIKTKVAFDPITCTICGLGKILQESNWQDCEFVKPA